MAIAPLSSLYEGIKEPKKVKAVLVREPLYKRIWTMTSP